ncbi:MAG: anti-sigma factor family protein [Blastocatellia bacterium]
MICREFLLLYSVQLDGHAAEHDQIALQRHLRECAVCRRCAAEMRSLRADLRALATPQPPPELTGQIQRYLRQEAAQRAEASTAGVKIRASQLAGAGISWVEFRKFWFNSFANWLDGYRAKIFSQSVGAIVSLLLFFVVVTVVFKQSTMALATLATRTIFEDLATQTIFEDPNDKALRYQAALKAALLYTPPPPALNANGEIQGAVASLREEDVILTADVRKDGGATIIYVVPPNDPSVQAKLSTAMAQRGTFQGAKPNQNISTVAVVYLSSITTTARL